MEKEAWPAKKMFALTREPLILNTCNTPCTKRPDIKILRMISAHDFELRWNGKVGVACKKLFPR